VTWDLRLGSCLDPVTGLASLGDKSVDVVVTDPPYEAEAHTKGRRTKAKGGPNSHGHLHWKDRAAMGDAIAEAAPLPFAAITHEDRAAASAHMARVTRRWVLVFCQVEASQRWALDLTAAGLDYVRTMVWVKPDGQPQFSGDRPGVGYESIVVAHCRGRKRWNGGGRLGVFTESKQAGGSTIGGAPHPTTKPLPLMRELVSLFSDPGETILDPFAGSGSTGVACNQLGRNFLGWELSAEYHAIATRRLNGDEAKPRPEQPGLFDSLNGAA
jgi:DNA modification methylase